MFNKNFYESFSINLTDVSVEFLNIFLTITLIFLSFKLTINFSYLSNIDITSAIFIDYIEYTRSIIFCYNFLVSKQNR